MHQWVSRRSTATLSQCFHAQSCGNIICWIHTVGCFPFFSYFTLSVSLPLLGPFSLVSTCQLLPSVTGVCGNGLTHHPQSVMQGIWGITCNRRVTDLRLAVRHVVTVTLRLLLAARDETRFSVLTFKLEYKLSTLWDIYFFIFNLLVSFSALSSPLQSDHLINTNIVYCTVIVSIIDEPLPAQLFLEPEPRIDSCTIIQQTCRWIEWNTKDTFLCFTD